MNWTMHQVLYSSLFANRRVMSVRSWTHRSGITSDSDSVLLPPPNGTAIFAQTSRTSVSDTFPPVAATFCASALATPTDILQSFRYCAGKSKTSQPPTFGHRLFAPKFRALRRVGTRTLFVLCGKWGHAPSASLRRLCKCHAQRCRQTRSRPALWQRQTSQALLGPAMRQWGLNLRPLRLCADCDVGAASQRVESAVQVAQFCIPPPSLEDATRSSA